MLITLLPQQLTLLIHLTPPGPAHASLCVVLGPQPPGGLTYGGRGYSGSYAWSPGEEGNVATDATGERDEKDLFQ